LSSYGFSQFLRQVANRHFKSFCNFHECTETRFAQSFLYDGKLSRIFIQAFGKSVLSKTYTLPFLNDEFPKGMNEFTFHIAKA